MAAAERDVELTRRLGGKVLRVAFGWDAMEPERGRYDWSFWDDFVRRAERSGVELIPYVCYTPRWAARDKGDDFWRSPPTEVGDFALFMRAIVARYGRTIRSWELWNEPDNRAYWLGDAREFAALVRAGSAAVRSADPRAKVVLGGIATELSFLEALFEREKIAPAVDVVNLHSYFETWHPDPIESLPEFVAGAAEIVREHGENEPLWMAETGYSSVGGRAEVSEVYRARFIGEHTPRAQAEALVRTFVLGLATRQLDTIAWYRINDLPARQDVIGDDNNRHLGVLAVHGREKPAARAFAELARWFAGPFQVVDVAAAVRRRGGDEHAEPVVRAFVARDGRVMVAAWIGKSGAGAPTGRGVAPVKDDRGMSLRLRLPWRAGGAISVVDALGEPVAKERYAVEARTVTLELRGGEVLCVRVAP